MVVNCGHQMHEMRIYMDISFHESIFTSHFRNLVMTLKAMPIFLKAENYFYDDIFLDNIGQATAA